MKYTVNKIIDAREGFTNGELIKNILEYIYYYQSTETPHDIKRWMGF